MMLMKISLSVCFFILQPCTLRDWELHVHFHIHGDAAELYGDGIAIWYTKRRLELGENIYKYGSTLYLKKTKHEFFKI